MTSGLVLCNHAKPDAAPTGRYDQTIHINCTPPRVNLNLHIDNITHRILSNLDPLAQDLLEIAAYVYYADCTVPRGTDKDVYADQWRRNLVFVIPVSDPKKWSDPVISDLLIEALEFITDDKLSLVFTPPSTRPTQLFLTFPNMAPSFPGADCISLFSGGLDSLVGSLFLLKERSERPLLISHRSMPKVDSRQKKLVQLLQERNTDWVYPHLSMWVNRKGNPAVEATQRSRSFLYLSIAAAVASQLKIQKIYICENGIVSVNIPRSGQNIGSLLTRSTHPKFLGLFEQLARNLFDFDLQIENPFIFCTKAEMLKMLPGWYAADLAQGTVSCSYTQRTTKLQPHCGTCSQCVDRRFSVAAAGLEADDKIEYYEKDIFLDPLEEGKETAYVEGYVRTAFDISEMNDVRFFAKYPELDEIVGSVAGKPDEIGKNIYNLFQKHAAEVISVASEKCSRHQENLLAGKLNDNCLISMLAYRRHLRDPLSVYAEKLARILQSSLRIYFQTEKPARESRLQESAEAALKAADERLRRESPMLSYCVVQTKPDFADVANLERLLFVEMKLLNNREKLNKVVTEITSRITIYRDQGAFVLFVVYDTGDFITDDEEFIRDLERHEKIKAIVVR